MHFALEPHLRGAFRVSGAINAAMAKARRGSTLSRPPQPSAIKRFAVRVALIAATSLIALKLVSAYFAGPLNMSAAGGDPRWIVEVTSTGDRGVTMLAYGRNLGLQFFRVPAPTADREIGRAIPFELAHGEIRMMSLGWSELSVRTTDMTSPSHDTRTATGRTITAYEPGFPSGARAGW